MANNLNELNGDNELDPETSLDPLTDTRTASQTPTKDELAGMIKEVDKDGNGEIDFDEYKFPFLE